MFALLPDGPVVSVVIAAAMESSVFGIPWSTTLPVGALHDPVQVTFT